MRKYYITNRPDEAPTGRIRSLLLGLFTGLLIGYLGTDIIDVVLPAKVQDACWDIQDNLFDFWTQHGGCRGCKQAPVEAPK